MYLLWTASKKLMSQHGTNNFRFALSKAASGAFSISDNFLREIEKKCHSYGHTVALCYIVVHTSFCLWQPVIWEVFVHTRWLPMYVQFLICLYFFALGVTLCIVRYWLRKDLRVAHVKWRVISELHVRESLFESFEIKFIYSGNFLKNIIFWTVLLSNSE